MAKNKKNKGNVGKKLVAWIMLITMLLSIFTMAIAVLAG